jgi:DNA-binding LacI/PurR family transcriptional regulator
MTGCLAHMKPFKKITQREIARKLGVSQTLVSCALSDKADAIGASPRTVERIREAAREAGYVPSATALELRGAPTKTIGVVVRDFEDPYLARLIGALQTAAREAGYSLLLTGAGEKDFHPLRKHRVDGIVLAGSHCLGASIERLLCGEGVPVVQLGWDQTIEPIVQVVMDEEAAIQSLVLHLRELGHQKIAFVAGKGITGSRRAAAFRKAVGNTDGKVAACPVLRMSPGNVSLQKMRRKGGAELPWSAVIASDDELALQLLSAFQARGQHIPRDLSIAGIDDIPFAGTSFPSLTTIRQPVEQLAKESIRRLATMRGKKANAQRFLFEGKLIQRESTARRE